MTRNTDSVQEDVLAKILDRKTLRSSNLKRFNLDRSEIPMIRYEELQPEIQRIANGDRTSIFINSTPSHSGTSGWRKKAHGQQFKQELDRRQLLYILLMPVMNLIRAWIRQRQRLILLVRENLNKETPGGLLASPGAHDLITRVNHFKTTFHSRAMYTQILCCLLEREPRSVQSLLPGLRRGINVACFRQLHWRELAGDIESGMLNKEITDPSVKDCMVKILKPNPKHAEFVQNGVWRALCMPHRNDTIGLNLKSNEQAIRILLHNHSQLMAYFEYLPSDPAGVHS
ncbi:LOW QUALITY PROTEIN: hypothetical protein NC651_004671 [Populus alba x Populus x berolinensis]|nr:LOW QUALITY PROTEIN: hypothetical protein NC651_004671 [Populus alba x Populus x berolinensis]